MTVQIKQAVTDDIELKYDRNGTKSGLLRLSNLATGEVYFCDRVDVARENVRERVSARFTDSAVRDRVAEVLLAVGWQSEDANSANGEKASDTLGWDEDPDELRDAALQVLGSENILSLVADYVRRAGYAGDVSAPQTVYLALTSRLLPRPVNLAVLGPSASGKNYSVRSVVPLFPASAYYELSGASPLAMVYNDDESFEHRYVIIAESSALHTEGIGASMMRALAWDPKLVYDTVVDGKHVHKEKPGPTGLITTSTKDLDTELATRLWTVPIADTPAQTRQILAITARRAAGLLADAPPPDPFVAAQQWLEAEGVRSVVVPFATALERLMPDHDVRLRRDFEQLLGLIRAHALLHQCRRDRDAAGNVVATIADYATVQALVGEVFTGTVGASKETIETVRAVAGMVSKERPTVSVSEVATRLKLSPSGAWHRCKVALAKHYLVNEETRRRQAARLRLGDPLPASDGVLPTPGEVAETFKRTSEATEPQSVARLNVRVNGGGEAPQTEDEDDVEHRDDHGVVRDAHGGERFTDEEIERRFVERRMARESRR